MLRRFGKDRKGATAIEYGLIVAVLSLVIIAGVSTAANSLVFLFSDSRSKLVRVWGGEGEAGGETGGETGGE